MAKWRIPIANGQRNWVENTMWEFGQSDTIGCFAHHSIEYSRMNISKFKLKTLPFLNRTQRQPHEHSATNSKCWKFILIFQWIIKWMKPCCMHVKIIRTCHSQTENHGHYSNTAYSKCYCTQNIKLTSIFRIWIFQKQCNFCYHFPN